LFLITWLRERMRGLARWSTLPLVRLLDFKELLLNLATLKEIKHQHLARKRELDKQIRGLQEELEHMRMRPSRISGRKLVTWSERSTRLCRD
jgi:hypothetical protein